MVQITFASLEVSILQFLVLFTLLSHFTTSILHRGPLTLLHHLIQPVHLSSQISMMHCLVILGLFMSAGIYIMINILSRLVWQVTIFSIHPRSLLSPRCMQMSGTWHLPRTTPFLIQLYL